LNLSQNAEQREDDTKIKSKKCKRHEMGFGKRGRILGT